MVDSRDETVLSGDLSSPLDEAGNAHHVVVGSIGAPLDGFVVTGGHADGPGITGHGGGLYLESVATQLGVVNTRLDGCAFTGNIAAQRGGAVAVAGDPVLAFCTFRGNRSSFGGGVVSADVRVAVIRRGCTFEDNDGGADVDGTSAVIDEGAATTRGDEEGPGPRGPAPPCLLRARLAAGATGTATFSVVTGCPQAPFSGFTGI